MFICTCCSVDATRDILLTKNEMKLIAENGNSEGATLPIADMQMWRNMLQ